jgi:dihydropteroate synthase
MGIVNVTPDSFSDGGLCVEPQVAIQHALKLVADGADVLDIGGESTRPGAQPVSVDEELRRVLPVIENVCRQVKVPVSIDTSKAAVARAAVAAGAEIVNDVTALRGDAAMLGFVRESCASVCLMHMQGTPRTMQDNPIYADVVAEVIDFLKERRNELEAAGIPRERICLDPGIGFGKTLEHNLELLRNCWRLHELECPVLVGPSRKAFIGHLLTDAHADRSAGTVGVCCALAVQGVQIVRVHAVAEVRQALELFEKTAATGGPGTNVDSP